MHEQQVHKLPAIEGSLRDAFEMLLRHLRIMLQAHGANDIAFVNIAHRSYEHCTRAVLPYIQCAVMSAHGAPGVESLVQDLYLHGSNFTPCTDDPSAPKL